MLAFKFSTAFIYFFAHFDLVSSVHFFNLALGCLENKDPKDPPPNDGTLLYRVRKLSKSGSI